jgi:hypothetical protein
MLPDSLKSTRIRGLSFAALFLGAAILLSLGIFATWTITYPDPFDPKNIHYVFWKHGLNRRMDLDSALVAMSHDTLGSKLVEGLTREELRGRFGYMRTFDEVTPYLRECYTTPGSAGDAETHGNKENVVFLRNSPWMVVMQNGRATDLILCKGY